MTRRSALVTVLVVGAVGCAGASRRAAPLSLPTCIRAEAADHTSGVQTFTFDADGNLTHQVEFDNTGTELARTTVTWAPTAITLARTGAFGFTQEGVLGAHGELLAWKAGSERLELRWKGTFAPVTTPPTARFAFETYYHVLDEPLLPLDTAERSVWPRMRAFVFTGTVILHETGKPDARDTRATYDHGHQVERSVAAREEGARITTITHWRGDEPFEDTTSNGEASMSHRTFTWDRGHLARLTGGPDVTYTHDDAGTLRHVRTDHGGGAVLEVEVSRCEGHELN